MNPVRAPTVLAVPQNCFSYETAGGATGRDTFFGVAVTFGTRKFCVGRAIITKSQSTLTASSDQAEARLCGVIIPDAHRLLHAGPGLFPKILHRQAFTLRTITHWICKGGIVGND